MKATNAASAAGYVLAAELRACGVDLSFTPVLDLDFGASGVIGDRAFAPRCTRVVSLLAKSLMHGLLRAGMASLRQALPRPWLRQGRFSHTDIPVDRRSLKAILNEDAKRPMSCAQHHLGQVSCRRT
jgi:beta-N-acetylhexosaminidase